MSPSSVVSSNCNLSYFTSNEKPINPLRHEVHLCERQRKDGEGGALRGTTLIITGRRKSEEFVTLKVPKVVPARPFGKGRPLVGKLRK